jgi:hypothetical protein
MAMCWPFGRRSRVVDVQFTPHSLAPRTFPTVQSHYDASFAREMGCTEAEWLGWLPAAIGAHAWQREGQCVCITLNEPNTVPTGLCIRWSVGEPRVIALARIPRLLVQFDFSAADAAQRYRFMRRFDLYMQRGGG